MALFRPAGYVDEITEARRAVAGNITGSQWHVAVHRPERGHRLVPEAVCVLMPLASRGPARRSRAADHPHHLMPRARDVADTERDRARARLAVRSVLAAPALET